MGSQIHTFLSVLKNFWKMGNILDTRNMVNTMLGSYKMQTVLGNGCYGYVIKCVKCETKEVVAVKILKKRGENPSKIKEVSHYIQIII